MSALLVESTADAASLAAAALLARAVSDAIATRGAAHLALSGGSTPRRCYELLGPLVADWRAVHIWFCDERCVAPDDPQSNFAMATDTLDAPGAVWHRIKGELGAVGAAGVYERELAGRVLDIALLGIGEDGHTASLFPGHPALEAAGRVVAVSGAPKPPPERVSLTLQALDGVRELVLLVSGHEKGPALAAALATPSLQTPASLLERDHLHVVATQDALAGS